MAFEKPPAVDALGLIACADPDCPTCSRSLPEVVTGWAYGLCPQCRDPRNRALVLDILKLDRRRQDRENR